MNVKTEYAAATKGNGQLWIHPDTIRADEASVRAGIAQEELPEAYVLVQRHISPWEVVT
ncbi:hypothetical protein ANMWB30_09540 [Arthrobacter sp. MWB30]|nr:hypothetical protein ANMWB30_09540 [Arthrobacter sp. MWB30]